MLWIAKKEKKNNNSYFNFEIQVFEEGWDLTSKSASCWRNNEEICSTLTMILTAPSSDVFVQIYCTLTTNIQQT